MVWFKVDDNFAHHPKALAAGNTALGLWVRAGAWCGQQLTGGFIPHGIIPTLGGRKRDVEALVKAGLWGEEPGGYRFHQWDERQPTREQVEADREAARDRQRKARERARKEREQRKRAEDAEGPLPEEYGDHAVTGGEVTDSSRRDSRVTNGVSHGPPVSRSPRPDPTRPDPTVVPTELLKVPPTAGADVAAAGAELAPTTGPTAQTLVAEWIDHCGNRPPEKVIGQVSKLLREMLAEGIDYDEVRAGLAAWQRKGINPSALPSVVHETRTQHTRAPTAVSTTDARMAAVQALKADLRPDQRSIGA